MRILFIGGGYGGHMMVLANAIKSIDTTVTLDWYTNKSNREQFNYDFLFPIDNLYVAKQHFGRFFYRIPKLSGLLSVLDFKLSTNTFIKNKYDVVHIHFVQPYYNVIITQLRRCAKAIVATPWGSDINLVHPKHIKGISRLLNRVDYVTAVNEAVKKTVVTKFKVPSDKVHLLWVTGTQALEDVFANESMTRAEAKEKFGVKDKYIIAIGTNSSPAQNHLQILQVINEIKEKLPSNYLLIVLLGRDKEYDEKVIDYASISPLSIRIINRRLSREEMLLLRKSTDLLIHAQPADVDSCSMKEALLCDTMIVNGSWLKYPSTERWGMPYYIFDSFDTLGKIILRAIANSDHLKQTDELKKYLHTLTMNNIVGKVIDFYKFSINNSHKGR